MSDQLRNIWEKTLNLLEKEVFTVGYNTWFEPIVPVSMDSNSIVISVKAEFNKNYLENNYIDLIKNAVKAVTHKDYHINIRLESDIKKEEAFNDANGNNYVYGYGYNNGYTNGYTNGAGYGGDTSNGYNNGGGYVGGYVGGNGGGNGGGYGNGYTNGYANGVGYENGFSNNRGNGFNNQNITMLNPKYTFDTFVIGNGNKLAHAASLAVAESMVKTYNPLFLYGAAGLGKTHLMHAIGNYIIAQNPGIKVIYVPSEKFTNELINSIKDDKTIEFRQRYRIADLFLLDDVQFISRKERTQEEFFHTFNELYNAGKQIVITSDTKPSDLPIFENRLTSRFEWGLMADIQPPDFETRIAILRKKAQMQEIYVSDDVMTYIAEHIPSNIRKLEGALNRIIAYASLTDYDLSVSIAEEALKDIISTDTIREITSTLVINTVCKYFGLRDDEIISKKRNRDISYPRQIAMYLCRDMTGMSLPSIGTLFGGRDHTTVMHAIKKVNEDLLTKSDVKQILDSLINEIKGE